MTDNLFDRLADLFRSSGPVNWRLAREIAESAAGESQPIDPWLDEEYRDLAATAMRYVDAASRLDASSAATTISVVDRRGWASSSVEGFAYFAEPLAGKFQGEGQMPELMRQLGPALVGLQIGGMVGAMSERILAGFDVGLPSGVPKPLTFVATNVEQFANDHDLDPRQVRLWVAMQEITHVAAMAIPWVHDQAVMRVGRFVDSLEVNSDGIGKQIEMFQDPDAMQRLMDGEGEAPGLLAVSGDAAEWDEVVALMAVVEGYAEFLVDSVMPTLLPQIERLRTAIDRTRLEPSPGDQMLTQMLGVDLSHGTYRRGATFCSEVARRWGVAAVDRIWEAPETLPFASELDDPVGWAARVLLSD